MSGRRWWVALFFSAGATVLAAGGCQSKSTFQFDGLDMLPPTEVLNEFSLGDYSIPISVVEDRGHGKLTRSNRFQFDFTLYALVSPGEKSQIENAWENHEGEIRDQVMSVCRGASLDELQEPELATLKARLTDVLAAKLGDMPLRQLVINKVVSQQL
ncbi:MAG TPA: flagellar basal body-associated FliL family protein [Lacipirellulaceae bacterium]|nr:flagellar basal body-associated FliL family protein [Lacipirellulaceae bacterium]